MSKSTLYSFRLGYDGDEAKAHDILKRWRRSGYEVRAVITAALLSLEGHEIPAPESVDGIHAAIDRLAQIAADLAKYNGVGPRPNVSELETTSQDISRRLRRAAHNAVDFDEVDE